MIRVCPQCGSHFDVSENDARCPRDGEQLRPLEPDEPKKKERLSLWGSSDGKDPPTVRVPALSIEEPDSIEFTPVAEDAATPIREEKITTPMQATKRAGDSPDDASKGLRLEFDEQTAEEYPSFEVKPEEGENQVDDEATDDGGSATTPDWGTQRKMRPQLDADELVQTSNYNPKALGIRPTDDGTLDDTGSVGTLDDGTLDDTDGGTLEDTDGSGTFDDAEGDQVDQVDGIDQDAETIDIRRAKLLVEPAAVPASEKPDKESRLAVVSQDKRQFGRYVLHCRFASGGMADLYLASIAGPAGFEKLVAIKRIHENLTAQAGFLEMFLDEARLAARISHPNVVDVLELGRIDDAYFIAMEYVPGQSLRSLLRRTRLPYVMAAKIVSGAAAGLHAAHELCDNRGELLHVVHRDVSPGNILISYEGEVKVLDFGVARARGNLHTTAVGMVKGKFAYMAPEQANTQPVDRRTDIFSLGIVLYEATTRRRLFKADTEQATLIKVLHEPILPPSALTEDYPMELERIVLKALEREPARRFQTAKEMHDALAAFVHDSRQRLLPGAISARMKQTFASQIAEQETLIRRCKTTSSQDIPIAEENWDILDNPSGSAVLDGTVSAAKQAQRRRRIIRLCLVAGLLLVAVPIAVLITRSESSRQPPPSPHGGNQSAVPKQPEAVQISISATPANAKIVFDGEEQPNPCDLTRLRSDAEATVVISAPGYVTRSVQVSLSRAGQLVISLDRERKAAPPSAGPDAGPRRQRHKRPRVRRPTRSPTRSPTPPPTPEPPKKPERVKKLFSNPYEK